MTIYTVTYRLSPPFTPGCRHARHSPCCAGRGQFRRAAHASCPMACCWNRGRVLAADIGSRRPWPVCQNDLHDMLTIRFGRPHWSCCLSCSPARVRRPAGALHYGREDRILDWQAHGKAQDRRHGSRAPVSLVRIGPFSLHRMLMCGPDAAGGGTAIPCRRAAGQHRNSRRRLSCAVFPELICCCRTHLTKGERI